MVANGFFMIVFSTNGGVCRVGVVTRGKTEKKEKKEKKEQNHSTSLMQYAIIYIIINS
jgi:hypothetical protein